MSLQCIAEIADAFKEADPRTKTNNNICDSLNILRLRDLLSKLDTTISKIRSEIGSLVYLEFNTTSVDRIYNICRKNIENLPDLLENLELACATNNTKLVRQTQESICNLLNEALEHLNHYDNSEIKVIDLTGPISHL